MSQPYREGRRNPHDPWDHWLGPHERTPIDRVSQAIQENFEDAQSVLALVEAQGREIARLQTIVLCLLKALGQSTSTRPTWTRQ